MEKKRETARPSGPERPVRRGRVMSGLDYLRSMIEDAVPSSAFCGTLGIRLVEVDHGRTLYLCEPSDQHTNALGISHGGLAAALIDSATGSAVLSTQPVGGRSTTIELKVNFVRPMTAGMGTVRCEGKVIHLGRRIATAEAHITDSRGRLMAHGSATVMVFPDEA